MCRPAQDRDSESLNSEARLRKIPLLFGLVFLAVACSSSTSPAVAMPLATGASLQSYLDVQDYRETWALYSGKGKLYEPETPSPHGALLTAYLNEAALQTTGGRAHDVAADTLPLVPVGLGARLLLTPLSAPRLNT